MDAHSIRESARSAVEAVATLTLTRIIIMGQLI